MAYTYNPMDVTITVAGKIVTGFSEGTMVSASKDEDNFQTKMSAKGEASMAITNNRLGTITLTLSQGSPFVALLNQYANNGKQFPIWIKNNGEIKETFGGTKAAVKKNADAEYSDEVGDREFEIQVFDYTVK
ncbi:DUF3277 family protein [Bacillus pumilus]|uniref:DUF3277 domain-containing protein n=2 Tax=Bacillus TaxID=1386 RepID=A0AAC9IEN9_9BACI|nr:MULTISPECIES: DUF3277 family protein [Bacillus]AOZ88130.1 DUF3277 domain-containing protein [Bacillus xiamenensis]MCP1147394.1 DUF3277 family protein [Bacillus sp. 1735sda2]